MTEILGLLCTAKTFVSFALVAAVVSLLLRRLWTLGDLLTQGNAHTSESMGSSMAWQLTATLMGHVSLYAVRGLVCGYIIHYPCGQCCQWLLPCTSISCWQLAKEKQWNYHWGTHWVARVIKFPHLPGAVLKNNVVPQFRFLSAHLKYFEKCNTLRVKDGLTDTRGGGVESWARRRQV